MNALEDCTHQSLVWQIQPQMNLMLTAAKESLADFLLLMLVGAWLLGVLEAGCLQCYYHILSFYHYFASSNLLLCSPLEM